MDVYYPDAAIGIEIIEEPDVARPDGLPEDAVTLYVGEEQLDDMNLMDALFSFICGRAEDRARKAGRHAGKAGCDAAGKAEPGAGCNAAGASLDAADKAPGGDPNGKAQNGKDSDAKAPDSKSPVGEKLADLIASRSQDGSFPYASFVAGVGTAPEQPGGGTGTETGAGAEDGEDDDDDEPLWSYEEWLENWLDAIYSPGTYAMGKQPLLNVESCKNLYLNV